jgi:hypothetical protein
MISYSNLRLHLATLALCIGTAAAAQAADNSPFNLLLMPDTQTYAQDHPHIFDAQTKWIADNASTITFVLHLGDITNRNNHKQWKVAQRAMNKLDGKVPYTLAVGNHDIGTSGTAKTRETDLFNEYFPFDKFSARPEFGGAFVPGKMDNVWTRFEAGGKKWIILTLEFGPRNKVLDWANKVIGDNADALVIICTHAYMNHDDTRLGPGDRWNPKDYGVADAQGADAVNDGDDIWEKLADEHKNVVMVVSGHILYDGAGQLVSEGENGNKVYQMLSNYQGGVIGSENGGNGFLRILNIDPAAGKISVKSYSPHLKQFKTEKDQQFEFTDVDLNR